VEKAQHRGAAEEYLSDAWQRSFLFLDVLRRRGNIYREQAAKEVPHVLDFAAELIGDGRRLARPVNYGLVRIEPPKGVKIDGAKRPFVVVDPRAGHGPGIGGMKSESEIGAALQNGHPCYFIGFLPEPIPEQTTEDVWNAEAEFVAEVARRHPNSGKPVVVANCQAGWQTMIMAATHPDLAGPLLLAGSPLSYWNGVRGKNPMRYTGGLLGGSWLTSLAGDIGGGKFDGANLVANFESLDPAHTYFDKPYNVYSKVDTEAERFLDFETWWGSPILMNAAEIQWIVDNLFIGNRLTTGELRTSEGLSIDLRNIQSPIVVFCSQGDNITPPQQALGWITDIYETDEDLIAGGQTIVYSIHDAVGHLGIFVSGKVATREHDEFASAMDLIDLMPPGLYEAVIEEIGEDTVNRQLTQGNYILRLEPRTLDHIRTLGGNSPEDDLKFETVKRVSAINLRLYETYLRPIVRSFAPPALGELSRRVHPNRLRFSIFSDENPGMSFIAKAAQGARQKREETSDDNIFRAGEQAWASAVSGSLEAFGAARDMFAEQLFHFTYGAPFLQALVGVGDKETPGRHPERDLPREQARAARRAELETHFETGAAIDAALRAIAYVRSGEGGVDERAYAVVKQLHDAQPPGRPRTMAELKEILHDQAMLLRLDAERAVAAIPKLLPRDPDDRSRTLRAVQRVVSVQGELSAEAKKRLARIERLFAEKSVRPTKEHEDASA